MDFLCNENKLTSIEQSPINIGELFDCSNNLLTDLKCSIERIKSFNCSDNKLTSLKGCPQEISNYFNCKNNYIQNLDDFPLILKSCTQVYCNNNCYDIYEISKIKIDDFLNDFNNISIIIDHSKFNSIDSFLEIYYQQKSIKDKDLLRNSLIEEIICTKKKNNKKI